MIKNRVFALTYRIIAFCACLFGVLFSGITFEPFEGGSRGALFVYYTIQSNILAIGLFGLLAFKTAQSLRREALVKYGAGVDRRFRSKGDPAEGEGNAFFPRLSAGTLVAVLLTLIVFWLVLAPLNKPPANVLFTYQNLAVHLICPLLLLADYIMFSKPGALKKQDPFYFIIPPTVYLVMTLIICSQIDTIYGIPGLSQPASYPYPFLDFTRIGYYVIPVIVGIAGFYLGLSYLMLYIDKKRSGKLLKEKG